MGEAQFVQLVVRIYLSKVDHSNRSLKDAPWQATKYLRTATHSTLSSKLPKVLAVNSVSMRRSVRSGSNPFCRLELRFRTISASSLIPEQTMATHLMYFAGGRSDLHRMYCRSSANSSA